MSRAQWQAKLAEKLVAVFRPDNLGRLVRRQRGRSRAEVHCTFEDPALDVGFSFATQSRSEVRLADVPAARVEVDPVFLPTRELLTTFPGFVTLYDGRYLEFPETWRDTCALLAAPGVRGSGALRAAELLYPLEAALGGQVVLDRSGRFYFVAPGPGRLEIHLVAEGLRKLAMLARLISTGALLDNGYLFWDEPEANLGPRLTKKVAGVILHLARSNIQIFIATHSPLLVRELGIGLRTHEFTQVSARFFGLRLESGEARIEQGDTVEEVGTLASLDEEQSQARRPPASADRASC